MKRIAIKYLTFVAVIVICNALAFYIGNKWAESNAETVPDSLIARILHSTVEPPGPRNRTLIGIGEEVSCEIRSFSSRADGSDLVWVSDGNGAVCPVVGSKATLTADLLPETRPLSVSVCLRVGEKHASLIPIAAQVFEIAIPENIEPVKDVRAELEMP